MCFPPKFTLLSCSHLSYSSFFPDFPSTRGITMPPLAANIRFPWSDLLAWDFLLRYIRDITTWKNVSRSCLQSIGLVMRRAAYKYVTVSPSLEIWIEKGAINAAKTLSNLNPFEMCQGAHHSRSISQNEGLLAICFVKPFPPSEENWFLNMESWFWQQPWKKHWVLDDQSNKSTWRLSWIP